MTLAPFYSGHVNSTTVFTTYVSTLTYQGINNVTNGYNLTSNWKNMLPAAIGNDTQIIFLSTHFTESSVSLLEEYQKGSTQLINDTTFASTLQPAFQQAAFAPFLLNYTSTSWTSLWGKPIILPALSRNTFSFTNGTINTNVSVNFNVFSDQAMTNQVLQAHGRITFQQQMSLVNNKSVEVSKPVHLSHLF